MARLEIQKARAMFESSSRALPPIVFLVCPVKRKQDSGGFKPPQTKSAENSD